MDLALAQGADIVEVDIVRSKDGHFVALHLPSLRFLLAPPWHYRLAELPPVDPLPRILGAIRSRAPVYLDIKQPLDEGSFRNLADLVDDHHGNQVIVGSFHRAVLYACRKYRPHWIVNYDCWPRLGAIEDAKQLGADWVNPIPLGIRRRFADRVHELGLRFVPAGTESPARQLRFLRWGAYALSTFYPARLRQRLQQVFSPPCTS